MSDVNLKVVGRNAGGANINPPPPPPPPPPVTAGQEFTVAYSDSVGT